MAGIKFHGAVDTLISHNHIYRVNRGIWLDWMSQGTRVTGNLLHDNGSSEDIFVEVNHGPFVIDKNLLFSKNSMLVNSQCCTYAHNLVNGRVRVITGERRKTPYLKEHGTEMLGLAENLSGDERWYNNLIVNKGLSEYDAATLPMFMGGNVYLNEAAPSKHDSDSQVFLGGDPRIELVEKGEEWFLQIKQYQHWRNLKRSLVNTRRLGEPKTTGFTYRD